MAKKNILDKTAMVEKDKRKVRKLVEGKNFDLLIMYLIFMDAIILGVMASIFNDGYLALELFILDRLFMAIFIVEMLMKLYAYGPKFFKNGWNAFDFTVVALSSVSMFSYFIILRAFRLFRLLKYVDKCARLKTIINTFIMLIPNFVAMLLVMAVFLYVFAIMGVSLFGEYFAGFATLGASLFTLLQVFTLDGWAGNIARPVMAMYPHAWLYFVSFLFISFLAVVSFVMNVISEVVEVVSEKKFKIKSRL